VDKTDMSDKIELNITTIQTLAYNIATKNKVVMIYMILVFSTLLLAYAIPLLNVFAPIFSFLFSVSISKYIFDRFMHSSSSDEIVDSFAYQSSTKLIFSHIRFALGVLLGLVSIIIPLAIIASFGAISMVFAIFSAIIIAMFWYILPLLLSVVATQDGFYDTYIKMFYFFKDSLWKRAFSKDYLVNIIYISLVLIIINIISILAQGTIILIPLSAFLTLFSAIYLGLVYYYIYKEFYESNITYY
jgi:hypothetical protein